MLFRVFAAAAAADEMVEMRSRQQKASLPSLALPPCKHAHCTGPVFFPWRFAHGAAAAVIVLLGPVSAEAKPVWPLAANGSAATRWGLLAVLLPEGCRQLMDLR